MKKVVLIIFISFFSLTGCIKEDNKCDTKLHFISKAIDKNGYIYDIGISSKKGCEGNFIELNISNNIYKIFANSSNKVLNQAVPFGFSIKKNKNPAISIGVEKNFIDKFVGDIKLLEGSKIDVVANKIYTNYKILTKNTISNLSIISSSNKKISFKKDNICKDEYIDILKTPHYFEKELKSYYIPPYKSFLKVCKELIKNDIIFDSKKALELSKNDKKLYNYLKSKFIKRDIYSKKSIINIVLLDKKTFKKLSSKDFIFIINTTPKELKIKKETPTFEYFQKKGIFFIEALSKNYYGKSKAIISKNGYLYLTILVDKNP